MIERSLACTELSPDSDPRYIPMSSETMTEKGCAVVGDTSNSSSITESLAPSAAYIHVPFCRYHCAYCNFTVLAGHDQWILPYLEALEIELQTLGSARNVQTIYVGGGSPTHLPSSDLARLLTGICNWLHLVPDPLGRIEFTVEANPEEVSVDCLRILAHHGVNRISLGVQSFQSRKLLALDRTHTIHDVYTAIEEIRSLGLTLSLDLMFAAPEESFHEWESDLEFACRIRPEHVSTYGLTLEKGTLFWNRRLHQRLSEVDEELQRAMYLHALDRLTQAGYEHYEVSNFALPGHRSLHNQVYWRCEPYFGFGPGAARYVDERRELNHRSTATWFHRVKAGRSPSQESESLDEEQRARERLVFGLRMLDGIDVAQFESESRRTLASLAGASISRFIEQGMLERHEGRLRLTRNGLLVSDSLWPDLI